MRTFIALPLSQLSADKLGDVSAQLSYQDKGNAVRWTDQNNFHITLAFLGDLYESELEELADALDTHIDQMSFDLNISHLSPFPESRPKLVAAMVDSNENLRNLYKQVMSAVLACQIQTEKKKFKPHITLGRFRHSKQPFSASTPKSMELIETVSEVTIFESILNPSGATYEAVFRYPLDDFEGLYDVD